MELEEILIAVANNISREDIVKSLEVLELKKATTWQEISSAPKDEVYLGCVKHGEPYTCEYNDDNEQHQCQFQTELAPHIPTHWMALPQPPKEGE